MLSRLLLSTLLASELVVAGLLPRQVTVTDVITDTSYAPVFVTSTDIVHYTSTSFAYQSQPSSTSPPHLSFQSSPAGYNPINGLPVAGTSSASHTTAAHTTATKKPSTTHKTVSRTLGAIVIVPETLTTAHGTVTAVRQTSTPAHAKPSTPSSKPSTTKTPIFSISYIHAAGSSHSSASKKPKPTSASAAEDPYPYPSSSAVHHKPSASEPKPESSSTGSCYSSNASDHIHLTHSPSPASSRSDWSLPDMGATVGQVRYNLRSLSLQGHPKQSKPAIAAANRDQQDGRQPQKSKCPVAAANRVQQSGRQGNGGSAFALFKLPQELQDIILEFAYVKEDGVYLKRFIRESIKKRRRYKGKLEKVNEWLVSKRFFRQAACAYLSKQQVHLGDLCCFTTRHHGLLTEFVTDVWCIWTAYTAHEYDDFTSLRKVTLAVHEYDLLDKAESDSDRRLPWEEDFSDTDYARIIADSRLDQLSGLEKITLTGSSYYADYGAQEATYDKNLASLEAALQPVVTRPRTVSVDRGQSQETDPRPLYHGSKVKMISTRGAQTTDGEYPSLGDGVRSFTRLVGDTSRSLDGKELLETIEEVRDMPANNTHGKKAPTGTAT